MHSLKKRILPVLSYFIVYMLCFAWLEQEPRKFHIIDCSLDTKIPFCEYFVIPYFLWFLYIAGTVLFFLFFNKNDQEYWRLVINLMAGMTLFLIISFVYPNGLHLRPEVYPRDNIFTDMVRYLHAIDTSTNVLPSIHVYNSVAAYQALSNYRPIQKNKPLLCGFFLLTVLIILSTLFLKQHSVFDVALAFVCNTISYLIIYRERNTEKKRIRKPVPINTFAHKKNG